MCGFTEPATSRVVEQNVEIEQIKSREIYWQPSCAGKQHMLDIIDHSMAYAR